MDIALHMIRPIKYVYVLMVHALQKDPYVPVCFFLFLLTCTEGNSALLKLPLRVERKMPTVQ